MGTRGLYAFRFRGRYYIYYNHLDSYPDVLGSWLVDEIPIQDIDYEKWLSALRAKYVELEIVLENKILTLTGDPSSSDLDVKKWQYILDERLEYLPSAIAFPECDVFIEWVYIFDLDRQVFSVRGKGSEAHYPMNKIPRGTAWYQIFQDFEVETGPNTQDGVNTVHRLDQLIRSVKDANKSYLEKYASLVVKELIPNVCIDPYSDCRHEHLLRALLFRRLTRALQTCLMMNVLYCCPSDFAFREIVYAVISFASGSFRLQSRGSVAGDPGEGYCWSQNETGTRVILPVLGKGCHAAGVEPGSAPRETTYYFQGVVVCIADALESSNNYKAAIAKAVDYGQSIGLVDFYSMIISLWDVVVVRHAAKQGSVAKTSRIPLLPFRGPMSVDTLHSPLFDEINASQGTSKDTSDNAVCLPSWGTFSSGFNVMIDVFDRVARRQVNQFSASRRTLPMEICFSILELVDDESYRNCSLACREFHAYTQSNRRVGEFVLRQHASGSKFIVTDRTTGRLIESELRDGDSDYEPNATWLPVLGSDANRQSLFVDGGIGFGGLHMPPLAGNSSTRNDYFVEGTISSPGISVKSTVRDWENFLNRDIDSVHLFATREPCLYSLPRNTHKISLVDLRGPVDGDGETSMIFWIKKGSEDTSQDQIATFREVNFHLKSYSKYKYYNFALVFGTRASFYTWSNGSCEAMQLPNQYHDTLHSFKISEQADGMVYDLIADAETLKDTILKCLRRSDLPELTT